MSTTVIDTNDFAGGRAAAALFRDQSLPARRVGHTRSVPGTQQRAYLKALRGAELAAWQNEFVWADRAADPLRRARGELAHQGRADAWLFTVVGCIAALALVFAFRDSLDITRHWDGFTQFVQQVFG